MENKKLISTTQGICFEQLDGQSILNASIEAAYPINHSCHSGRCGFCKAKVVSGKTHSYRQEELSQSELDNKVILTCARTAISNVQLEVGHLNKVQIPKSINIPCVIKNLTRVSANILRVTLQLPLIARLPYIPGQYIDLTNADGVRRSFSLAKAKVENQMIEIHISCVENGVMSDYWFNQAKASDLLTLEGSKGTFFLRGIENKDVYFIATGTGIAPVNAILESMNDLPKHKQARSITVIWGNRTPESFYLNLKDHDATIDYIPTLSAKHNGWNGSYGYVQDILMERKPDLTQAKVYACGSPIMINHAQKLLKENGLPEQDFLADAFVKSGL